MKTITLKDVILNVADEDQLAQLCGSMTPTQYFELMNNVGAEGPAEEIGLLRQENKDSSVYLKSLVQSTGLPRKFWKNANDLVMAVNENVDSDVRKSFHMKERLIDPSLIEMLKSEVPEVSKALGLVVEREPLPGTLLGVYLNTNWSVPELRVKINDKHFRSRLMTEPFAKRHLSSKAMVFNIFTLYEKQFSKGMKNPLELSLGPSFIYRFVDPDHYRGIYEEELMDSSLLLTRETDDGLISHVESVFIGISAEKPKDTKLGSLFGIPTRVVATMSEATWGLLTTPCELVSEE